MTIKENNKVQVIFYSPTKKVYFLQFRTTQLLSVFTLLTMNHSVLRAWGRQSRLWHSVINA